jgi:hypothetical protein
MLRRRHSAGRLRSRLALPFKLQEPLQSRFALGAAYAGAMFSRNTGGLKAQPVNNPETFAPEEVRSALHPSEAWIYPCADLDPCPMMRFFYRLPAD